jgi:hypothetical protein
MPKSNYLKDAIIKHIFGIETFTAPNTLYLSLHSANPGATGANELSGNSYARKAFDANTEMAFGGADSGLVSSIVDLTFPTATGDWVETTHFGIWDASSGGNLLYYGPWDDAKTVEADDTLTVPSSNLNVSES